MTSTDLGSRSLFDSPLCVQDLDNGGIADRPGDWVDVFHTNFGLAGKSPWAL